MKTLILVLLLPLCAFGQKVSLFSVEPGGQQITNSLAFGWTWPIEDGEDHTVNGVFNPNYVTNYAVWFVGTNNPSVGPDSAPWTFQFSIAYSVLTPLPGTTNQWEIRYNVISNSAMFYACATTNITMGGPISPFSNFVLATPPPSRAKLTSIKR